MLKQANVVLQQAVQLVVFILIIAAVTSVLRIREVEKGAVRPKRFTRKKRSKSYCEKSKTRYSTAREERTAIENSRSAKH